MGMAEAAAAEMGMQNMLDIAYVCQNTLESLKEKLEEGTEVAMDDVIMLAYPENIEDRAMMVPVDMRGIKDREDFDDFEQMAEKLGAKGAAEAFVKAKKYFDDNPHEEPEEERPKPVTAAVFICIFPRAAVYTSSAQTSTSMSTSQRGLSEIPREVLSDPPPDFEYPLDDRGRVPTSVRRPALQSEKSEKSYPPTELDEFEVHGEE